MILELGSAVKKTCHKRAIQKACFAKYEKIGFVNLLTIILFHKTAPTGCLQYFTNSTGSIESFNFRMTGSIYPINMDYAICLKKQQGFGCLSLSTLTAGDGKKITLLLTLHKLDGSCDDKTKQSNHINDTY